MAAETNIAWADTTFNPWIGCTKISAGCKHCYAATLAERTRLARWGDDAPRVVTSPAYWRAPLAWDRTVATYEGKAGLGRRLVFVASMADVFEDRRDLDAPRAWLWELIERTPNLTWLLLTKRPENWRKLVPPSWRRIFPANVWIGTTAENNDTLRQRAMDLLNVPADVRFLSCEPLLEALDLDFSWCDSCGDPNPDGECEGGAPWCTECEQECVQGLLDPCADHAQRGINWVIVGGESGAGARPFDLAWAHGVVANCSAAGVPVFVKQMGSNAEAEDEGTGETTRQKFRARAGDDPSEWPTELQVRQWPERKEES